MMSRLRKNIIAENSIYKKSLKIKKEIESKLGYEISWHSCSNFIIQQLGIDHDTWTDELTSKHLDEFGDNYTHLRYNSAYPGESDWWLKIIDMSVVEVMGRGYWEQLDYDFVKEHFVKR